MVYTPNVENLSAKSTCALVYEVVQNPMRLESFMNNSQVNPIYAKSDFNT